MQMPGGVRNQSCRCIASLGIWCEEVHAMQERGQGQLPRQQGLWRHAQKEQRFICGFTLPGA